MKNFSPHTRLALIVMPTMLIALGSSCTRESSSTLFCGCEDDGSARFVEMRAVESGHSYLNRQSILDLIAQDSDVLGPGASFHVKEVATGQQSYHSFSFPSSGGFSSPPTSTEYEVDVRYCMDGIQGDDPITYAAYTRNVSGQQVAFLFEGEVLACPIVESELPPRGPFRGPDGSPFDMKTANDLAERLKP
jgi:hypothetical protein